MRIIADPDVDKFIFSLEKSTKGKMARMVELLGNFGHRIGLPYSK